MVSTTDKILVANESQKVITLEKKPSTIPEGNMIGTVMQTAIQISTTPKAFTSVEAGITYNGAALRRGVYYVKSASGNGGIGLIFITDYTKVSNGVYKLSGMTIGTESMSVSGSIQLIATQYFG